MDNVLKGVVSLVLITAMWAVAVLAILALTAAGGVLGKVLILTTGTLMVLYGLGRLNPYRL